MKKKFLIAAALTFLVASNVQAKNAEEVIELHPEKVYVDEQTGSVPFYREKKRELYKLRGGDELNIRVHGYPELSSPENGTTAYFVRPDGKFYMPLIGEVDALDRTVPDICQEIEARYARYLRDPIVDINVKQISKIRVYVLGQVERQGVYEFEKSPKLLEAIASAWGFVNKASRKNVFVIRAGEEVPCLKVDIRKLLKGETTGQNIALKNGDCVYITSNHKIAFYRDIAPIFSSAYHVTHL